MIKYIMSDLSEVIMQGYMGVGQELSPILNIPVEEIELEKTKNFPLFIKLMEGKLSEDEYIKKFLEITKWNISIEDFKNVVRKVLKKKIPGTIYILRELKKHHTSVLSLDSVREWVEYILNVNKDLEIFDYKFFSYELESIKEDNITFVKVLDKIKAKPEEIFFIDDSLENIKSAESIGITGVQFTTAEELEQKLKEKLILK